MCPNMTAGSLITADLVDVRSGAEHDESMSSPGSIRTCSITSASSPEETSASLQDLNDPPQLGAMPSPVSSLSWVSRDSELLAMFDDASSGRDHFGPNSRDYFLHATLIRSPSESPQRTHSGHFLPSMEKRLKRDREESSPENISGGTSPTARNSSQVSARDTMIMEQWQEICKLESLRIALESDLELKQSELKQAREQIDIQSGYARALQARIRTLESQLRQGPHAQYEQIAELSKQLDDARMFEQTRARTEDDGYATGPNRISSCVFHDFQLAILHEHVEQQQLEIRKWKQEAMARGGEAVTLNWQASVDEAVRREREKDIGMTGALFDEQERLRAMLVRMRGSVCSETCICVGCTYPL